MFSTLGVATVTASVTGGLSYAVAASAAGLTGLEIAGIIAATAIGLSLVIAVFKEYEDIDCQMGPNPYIRLRKKR